jgi:MtrB/PioB family decaheme-associated outer membrane protein
MKTFSPLFVLAALGVLSAAASSVARAQTADWKCELCPYPKGISGVVEAGLGAVTKDSATFGDMTGLQRKGAFVLLGGTATARGADGGYADVRASDLGLDTRNLWARGGLEGLFALQLGYDSLPRHFADGAQTPFLGIGSAVLILPAGFAQGNNAAMPLASTLKPVALGLDARRFDLAGTWLGSDRLKLRVSLRHDTRDGSRPVQLSFASTSAQAAAPVDQSTDVLEVAASYSAAQWQASLAYQLSQFRNAKSSLTWDNPFNAGARRGQLALAPDNDLHQIIGSAGYQFTPSMRASADFAVGRLTQNQAFLSASVNPQLASAAGALPALSLDGRVDTFNGSVRLTATPIDGLRLNASLSRDVRDNRTAVRSYPSVVADTFVDLGRLDNTPFSQWQDRFKAGADYNGPGTLRLSGGVEVDRRERSYTEAVTTRETTTWARAALQPVDMLALSLRVAHAQRDHSSYGTAVWFGAAENPLLRKFNLAARQRHSAGLRADLTLSETVSVGATLDHANDHYKGSAIGLSEARSNALGIDAALALAEHTRLHGYVQVENIRSLQNGSQAFAAPDWSGRSKDRFSTLGLGIQHTVIPDKLDIGLDLSTARSRSQLQVQTVLEEPDFPRASTAQDRIKLSASYQLKNQLWLDAGLLHERYAAQDWRLDGVLTASVPTLLALGHQAPQYRVNVLRLGLRYRY